MLHPKFIVQEDRLIIGKVVYHKQLSNDKSKIKGGGYYRYDTENKEFILDLTTSSFDFGHASLDDIKKAVSLGNIGNKHIPDAYSDHKIKVWTGSENILLN